MLIFRSSIFVLVNKTFQRYSTYTLEQIRAEDEHFHYIIRKYKEKIIENGVEVNRLRFEKGNNIRIKFSADTLYTSFFKILVFCFTIVNDRLCMSEKGKFIIGLFLVEKETNMELLSSYSNRCLYFNGVINNAFKIISYTTIMSSN